MDCLYIKKSCNTKDEYNQGSVLTRVFFSIFKNNRGGLPLTPLFARLNFGIVLQLVLILTFFLSYLYFFNCS